MCHQLLAMAIENSLTHRQLWYANPSKTTSRSNILHRWLEQGLQSRATAVDGIAKHMTDCDFITDMAAETIRI